MISPLPLPPKVATGDPIRAEHWNDMLAAVQSLQVQLDVAEPRAPSIHPWKVTATQSDENTLRIYVRAGCVNDTAATIVWNVKGDPRGDMPEEAKSAHEEALGKSPDSAFLKEYWDRPLHEAEPPFLALPLDPKVIRTQWTLSIPTRVPKALKDSASKEANFYVAGVVLAAFPFNIISTVPFPKRFRVYAGRANPAALRQARLGELLQLAQIWQVREGGELSTISVSQNVFWNVACMAVEPSLQKVGEVETPLTGLPLVDMWSGMNTAGANALGEQANSYLDMLESSLGTTQFWTV